MALGLKQKLNIAHMQVFKLKYEVTYMEYMYLLLTVVNCGALSNPANGQVNHTAGTTLGQTATYSSNTGYYLVGNSNRTCQATGGWSGSVPACQSMLLCMYMYVLNRFKYLMFIHL